MNIPEEAIELATTAVMAYEDALDAKGTARAALEAAAPLLMAMAFEQGRGALSIDANPYRTEERP